MSLVHLRFRKSSEQNDYVTYIVESSDFGDSNAWEAVAEISITKRRRSYSFRSLGSWKAQKVVPPYVYGLPEHDLKPLLAGEYAGFGYGAWTARIHRCIEKAISDEEYPDWI